jgi:hypothetical protein
LNAVSKFSIVSLCPCEGFEKLVFVSGFAMGKCVKVESEYEEKHHHHHHQWRYSPESGLGLPYGFRDRYITMWVISPTTNLVLVILI